MRFGLLVFFINFIFEKGQCFFGMLGSMRKTDIASKKVCRRIWTECHFGKGHRYANWYSYRCETPEEIALSILAKMVDVKNS